MENLEFDGFKMRRPRMEFPDLLTQLENIREEVHRVETAKDVKSLLQKLTDRAIDAMSHAKELEGLLNGLKEGLDKMKEINASETQWTDYAEFEDMISPLQDLPMSELEEAVGRLPGKPEFQDVLDDINGLFGDVQDDDISPLSVPIDVPEELEHLFPKSDKPSRSLLNLGDPGIGAMKGEMLEKDFDSPSQFDDKNADDMIDEFLGV